MTKDNAVARPPLRQAVLAVLEAGPGRAFSPRELTEAVQGCGIPCHPSAVARQCRKLCRRGQAEAQDADGETILLSCPPAVRKTASPPITPTFVYRAR